MLPFPLNGLVGTRPRVIDVVDTPVDEGEVLRYLGYPAGASPNTRLASILDRWTEEALRRAEPRAAYLVRPVVAKHPRRLRVATARGTTEFRGAIGEFLGAAEYVAAFIATAGPGVEALASQLLREGDHLAAMVANAVGAERAEAAETAVIQQLREAAEPSGFATTLSYSPGYCGMRLTEQTKLFSLLDGGAGVGVTLTKDCLMRPLKSVSGLIGLGPAEKVAAKGSPCDRCELYNCAMRR